MTLIMPGGQEPNNEDEVSDEIARLVQDGVKPKTAKERLQLAAEKLSGNVPLGVDASSKGLRKGIAGSAELLSFIKFGVFGCSSLFLEPCSSSSACMGSSTSMCSVSAAFY